MGVLRRWGIPPPVTPPGGGGGLRGGADPASGRGGPPGRGGRKFHFFFQNPAILGIASRKRVIFGRVTLCFATVSDFFSQKIAASCSSGTFFFDFFETVGYLEGHQCAPPLPYAAGGRARHSRFRGNLGSIFFRSKIDFFQFRFR